MNASRTSGPTSKAVGPDGRSHPGEHARGLDAQRAHAVLDHARRHAAPARVHRADLRARRVAEKQLHAVGGEHAAHAAGRRGDRAIGDRHARRPRARSKRTTFTPWRCASQSGISGRCSRSTQAVARDARRIVAAAGAEVQARVLALAHAARARRGEGAHARGRRPVGNDPVAVRHAPRSSCEQRRAGPRAPATRTSAACRVRGWRNASLHACSAWRARRRAPLPAVLGIALERDGRWRRGARGSGACARSRGRIRAACARRSVSRTR